MTKPIQFNYPYLAGGVLGGTVVVGSLSNHLMRNAMNTPVHVIPDTKVSVLMKSLNEEQRIADAIESILNQSVIREYPDFFEFILVDGGSDDRTLEIARQYPIKIVETRRGVLHQKNVGIESSTGDILVFVDSDSEYPEFWLGKIIEGFQKDDDIVMVRTPFLLDIDKLVYNVGIGIASLLLHLSEYAFGGGTAIKRVVFEETGLFDEGEDCVYLHRVSVEEENNIVHRANMVGKVIYQQFNPFITASRRFSVDELQHECVRNPQCLDCQFARDVGYGRF